MALRKSKTTRRTKASRRSRTAGMNGKSYEDRIREERERRANEELRELMPSREPSYIPNEIVSTRPRSGSGEYSSQRDIIDMIKFSDTPNAAQLGKRISDPLAPESGARSALYKDLAAERSYLTQKSFSNLFNGGRKTRRINRTRSRRVSRSKSRSRSRSRSRR